MPLKRHQAERRDTQQGHAKLAPVLLRWFRPWCRWKFWQVFAPASAGASTEPPHQRRQPLLQLRRQHLRQMLSRPRCRLVGVPPEEEPFASPVEPLHGRVGQLATECLVLSGLAWKTSQAHSAAEALLLGSLQPPVSGAHVAAAATAAAAAALAVVSKELAVAPAVAARP